jgi:hypothetical protein
MMRQRDDKMQTGTFKTKINSAKRVGTFMMVAGSAGAICGFVGLVRAGEEMFKDPNYASSSAWHKAVVISGVVLSAFMLRGGPQVFRMGSMLRKEARIQGKMREVKATESTGLN